MWDVFSWVLTIFILALLFFVPLIADVTFKKMRRVAAAKKRAEEEREDAELEKMSLTELLSHANAQLHGDYLHEVSLHNKYTGKCSDEERMRILRDLIKERRDSTRVN